MLPNNINPVPGLTIAIMAFCAILGILIPIGLLIWCRKKIGGSIVPFFVGCGTFFLFAMVLEPIMHNLVLISPVGPAIFNSIWPYAIYGGLAAGVFEETGRLVAMKWLKKKHNRPQTALIYGAGHGGIEVLLVMVITMVEYIVFAVMINSGSIQALLGTMDSTNQAALIPILQGLSQGNPFATLLSIVERISAVTVHISLSVLVWQAAVRPGKMRWFFIAIALHALLDAVTAVLARYGVNTIVVEAAVALMAAGLAVLARNVYKEEINNQTTNMEE